MQLRVEAAALDGRPVSFVVVYPWSARANAREREGGLVGMPALPMFMGIVWISLIAGILLVRRNYRLGRIDMRAAGTLAGAIFWLTLAAWLLRAHLSPTADTISRLMQAVGTALFSAGTIFVVYAGIDPYARRYWPASLVSWTRLVNSRVRDPLVGQDILGGTLGGLVTAAGLAVYSVIAGTLNARPTASLDVFRILDITPRQMLARSAEFATFALATGVGGLVLLLLLRGLLRRDWLAIVVWAALAGVTFGPALGPSYPLLAFLFTSLSFVPFVWTMHRYGMLATAVATWACNVSLAVATWDPTLWYGPTALASGIFVLGLAAYGLRTALAGRTMFGAGTLEGAAWERSARSK